MPSAWRTPFLRWKWFTGSGSRSTAGARSGAGPPSRPAAGRASAAWAAPSRRRRRGPRRPRLPSPPASSPLPAERLLPPRELPRHLPRPRRAGELAPAQAPARVEGAEDVRLELAVETAPVRGGERRHRDPARGRRGGGLADRLVRLAERDAPLDEVLGRVGRERLARAQRLLHPVRVEGGGLDRARHRVRGEGERLRGAEERALVLLEVAVVRERQPLHH